MLIRRNQSTPSRSLQSTFSSRQGVALLDILVAGIAISTAMLLAVATIAVVHRSRHRADHLQYASLELNNQLERASSLKWQELTSETVAKFQRSEMAAARIPEAQLKMFVTEVSEPRPGKRLHAQINWPDSDQNRHQPLHLTTWVFAPSEVDHEKR
jgi:hypothetical protein